MKNEYLKQIEHLIGQLNDCGDNERTTLLQQIKETDQLYLESQGMKVNGQILFIRHGTCASWEQKKYGLNPNSPLSDEAVNAMQTTNQSTRALLSHPDKQPRIVVSPMIRAMQTAALIIPYDPDKGAVLSIDPALSENSDAPSGLDIRSKEDLQRVLRNTSFFKTPLKAFLFFISNLFYSDKKLFDSLDDKRNAAAAKLVQYAENGTIDLYDKKGSIKPSLDYTGNKIEDINKLITQTINKDLMLIGHGNNFKKYFNEQFGINSTFSYGEIRSVYKMQADDEALTLFTPPYALVINQKTGTIEGQYTGFTARLTKEIEWPAKSSAIILKQSGLSSSTDAQHSLSPEDSPRKETVKINDRSMYSSSESIDDSFAEEVLSEKGP